MRQLQTCQCFRYNTRNCRYRNKRTKKQPEWNWRYQYCVTGRKAAPQRRKYYTIRTQIKLIKQTIKNKIRELKAQVKSLQKSLMGTSRKKVQYINKLKQTNGITCVRIEPNDWRRYWFPYWKQFILE